eukprot:SAG31_NODE_1159_length_9603_cov_8.927715_4_plen_141_part_00
MRHRTREMTTELGATPPQNYEQQSTTQDVQSAQHLITHTTAIGPEVTPLETIHGRPGQDLGAWPARSSELRQLMSSRLASIPTRPRHARSHARTHTTFGLPPNTHHHEHPIYMEMLVALSIMVYPSTIKFSLVARCQNEY